MKLLSFVVLAAAMSIWGLSSIAGGAQGGSHHKAFSNQAREAAAPSLRLAGRFSKQELGHDL